MVTKAEWQQFPVDQSRPSRPRSIEAPQDRCGPVGNDGTIRASAGQTGGDLTALNGLVASAEIDPLFLNDRGRHRNDHGHQVHRRRPDGFRPGHHSCRQGRDRTRPSCCSNSPTWRSLHPIRLLSRRCLDRHHTSSQTLNFTFPQASDPAGSDCRDGVRQFGVVQRHADQDRREWPSGRRSAGRHREAVARTLIDPLVSTSSARLCELGVNLGTVTDSAHRPAILQRTVPERLERTVRTEATTGPSTAPSSSQGPRANASLMPAGLQDDADDAADEDLRGTARRAPPSRRRCRAPIPRVLRTGRHRSRVRPPSRVGRATRTARTRRRRRGWRSTARTSTLDVCRLATPRPRRQPRCPRTAARRSSSEGGSCARRCRPARSPRHTRRSTPGAGSAGTALATIVTRTMAPRASHALRRGTRASS